MPEAAAEEEFEVFWRERGLETKTMTMGATATLVPRKSLLEHDRRATLPRVLSTIGGSSQLEVVGEIGQGGMGVVRLARQVALRRDVAIKQVRDDRRDERHAQELLQEGLLVGALEHPNIVPVYMLGVDDDGYPTIVMKRITGANWGDIVRGQQPVPDDDADDALGWHLNVLMDVSNAVHFANSRGIVHRDLKPDNVMVGDFGEVYVLDWGIAVSTVDVPGSAFPLASDANEVAGTPAYMAPEQVRGDGANTTHRTDVYLLGAILHEIVTGEVPHNGKTMFETMHHAFESPPGDYPGAPDELARACRRAMSKEPADRFASAEEFRKALAAFLRHRESMKMHSQGVAAADDLQKAVADQDEAACDEAYARARFAFDAALATWEGNEAARLGRQSLMETMVAWELALENPRAVRKLLADLPQPSPETVARLEALQAREATRVEKAEQLDAIVADSDLGQFARWRAILMFLIAFDWLVGLAVHLFIVPLSHLLIAGVAAAALIVGVGVATVARTYIMANRINRQLLGSYAVCVIGMLAAHAAVAVAGVTPIAALAADTLVFFAVAATMALTLDKRFAIIASLHLIGFMAIVVFRDHALAIFCLACAVAEAAVGVIALYDWKHATAADEQIGAV